LPNSKEKHPSNPGKPKESQKGDLPAFGRRIPKIVWHRATRVMPADGGEVSRGLSCQFCIPTRFVSTCSIHWFCILEKNKCADLSDLSADLKKPSSYVLIRHLWHCHLLEVEP
jgi:hypothetical protein